MALSPRRLKIFALSLHALRAEPDGVTDDRLFSIAVMAPDRQAAYQKGVERAIKEWPTKDGWAGHSVSCCEIPDQMVWAALDGLSGQPAG